MTSRRLAPRWLLVVLLVVMPLVELYVLIQVGQVIGAWWTILLLLADSILGGWLIRREGGRAWRALNDTVAQGRVPAKELADGVLVVTGGIFMISPGFVSDFFGLLLIAPFTRPLARRALVALVGSRLTVQTSSTYSAGFPGTFAAGFSAQMGPQDARRPGDGPEGPVVRGEVVDQ